MSLYADLIEAGQPVSNHYSDLYTPVNEVTRELVKKHGLKASIFTSQIDGKPWYDAPFAFDPYWEKRQ